MRRSSFSLATVRADCFLSHRSAWRAVQLPASIGAGQQRRLLDSTCRYDSDVAADIAFAVTVIDNATGNILLGPKGYLIQPSGEDVGFRCVRTGDGSTSMKLCDAA